jgi:hypothetical protein
MLAHLPTIQYKESIGCRGSIMIEDFVARIKRSKQHSRLYHFTDESNFEKINKLGLVSKQRMRSDGWWPQTTGGNDWSHEQDTRRGIDPYVSLCFTCNHPMKYVAHQAGRLPKPRYLCISPDVLLVPGVKVAFGVANANNTEILPLADAIERLDTEVIYSRTDWSNPEINQRLQAAEKTEVLVPHCVERTLILGVI